MPAMSPRSSLLAASLLVSATLVLPPRRVTSCYATLIALVADAHPYTIRRVVTTGVRRFDDAGGGTRAHCAPSDADARGALHRAVDKQLDADSAAAEWIDVSGVDADVPRNVLPHILAAVALHAPGFEFVEVVRDAPGALDTVATRLVADDSSHLRCLERNSELERRRADFRYAC